MIDVLRAAALPLAVLAGWWALTNEDLPDRIRAWVLGVPYTRPPVTVCRVCGRPYRHPDPECPTCNERPPL